MIDDILTAQGPFTFTILVCQDVTTTHVVAFQLAGTGFAKPFSSTFFCFRFRHNSTVRFVNLILCGIEGPRKRGGFIGEPRRQV